MLLCGKYELTVYLLVSPENRRRIFVAFRPDSLIDDLWKEWKGNDSILMR